MDVTLAYKHLTSSYDVYFYTWYTDIGYVCLVHGTDTITLNRNPDASGWAARYIRLSEGETLELHGVDISGDNTHIKSIYTASGGSITESDAVNVTTTLTSIT